MLDITLFHPTVEFRHLHDLGDGDTCVTLLFKGRTLNGQILQVDFSLHNCEASLLNDLRLIFGPPTGHDCQKPHKQPPPTLPIDEVPF